MGNIKRKCLSSATGSATQSSLLRERTRDDTKSRSGIFFFETTFIIVIIAFSNNDDNEERKRERAICQHRRFRSGLGKNERGVKTTHHHHHHHHGPRLEWRGRRNREANKRFAEESGGRNHGKIDRIERQRRVRRNSRSRKHTV